MIMWTVRFPFLGFACVISQLFLHNLNPQWWLGESMVVFLLFVRTSGYETRTNLYSAARPNRHEWGKKIILLIPEVFRRTISSGFKNRHWPRPRSFLSRPAYTTRSSLSTGSESFKIFCVAILFQPMWNFNAHFFSVIAHYCKDHYQCLCPLQMNSI